MKILVLHGPNLNLLGERPGDEKGKTLAMLNEEIERRARQVGAEVRILQSNHEGALIDAIHDARKWADAIVINPAALTHTSYVLREAIAAVNKPAIEVHLTDIRRRESWRRKSLIKDVCRAQILGKGFDSYLLAIDQLCGARSERKSAKRSSSETSASTKKKASASTPATAPSTPKTIGRKPSALLAAAGTGPSSPGAAAKTIGRKNNATGPNVLAPGGASAFLSRALVREKIAERLNGKLTASGLSTWARSKWLDVQRGAPAESGQRELLEDSLQQLVLSSMPPSKLSDEQLIELMTQLDA